MILRDGILAVRNKLGEITPNYWANADIIADLNESAKRMCSAAQNLNDFIAAPFAANQQEVALPALVDKITDIKYFMGILYPLEFAPQPQIQTGAFVGATPPQSYYVRSDTKVFTPQVGTGTNTGNIVETPIIDSRGQQINDAVTVIGLWPIPLQAGSLNVSYIPFHYQMKNLLDTCLIPERWKEGWIAYAAARGFEKVQNIELSQYYDAQHQAAVGDMKAYYARTKQAKNNHRWGRPVDTITGRGGSSVLIVGTNPTLGS